MIRSFRPLFFVAGLLTLSGCLFHSQQSLIVPLDALPPGIRSPDSNIPAGLLIHNESSHGLVVDWIDFDGERVPQTTIAAGKSGVIGAQIGHAFVIEGEDGRFLRVALANFPTEELRLTNADFATPDKYQKLTVEGWPIRLEKTLSVDESAALEAFLGRKLAELKTLIPAQHLPALQKVAIWVDKEAADRGQYHPGFYWMEGSGWHIDKYKAIHFGHAQRLFVYAETQPMVILHELSHAFHDQVLGFDDSRIEKAYLNARDKELYEQVAHINGKTVRAYAMKDEREYFAELTEAYFGRNDYFPYTRDELRRHDPVGYRMIEAIWDVKTPATRFSIGAAPEALAKAYKLDRSFYQKTLMVQDILIATSEKVADFALYEAADQFDAMMRNLDPAVAQRVRDKKVLCILVAHNELTSEIPQFTTDKTGKELDFYNWRQRGFLTRKNGQQIVLFAEEDVLEYPGGMQNESILIHEFAHVIHGAGFDKQMQERLTATFTNAKEGGLWNDGYASQRFGRVSSEAPVSLLDALAESFPDQPREFLLMCLEHGDILVNQKPANGDVMVTKEDKVRIVFGGPKGCYAAKNRSEYFAEVVQCWYDTNRSMDHDHNHIHTREQLQAYDPVAAKMCEEILGPSPWRFVSPRKRSGRGHLKGYRPAQAPNRATLPHIREAALAYYDEYWKEYWPRLRMKHAYE